MYSVRKSTTTTTTTSTTTSTTESYSVEDLFTTVTESFFNSTEEELTTNIYETSTSSTSSTSTEFSGFAGLDTSNDTMEMVPIYRLSPSTGSESITSALLGKDYSADSDNNDFEFEDYGGDPVAASFGAESESTDYVSVAIIMAGSAYVLYNLNRAVRSLYKAACSYSDPRLISLGHCPSRRTKVWAWTASVLEKVWPPLWFTRESLREEAVEESLEQIQRSRRISTMLLRESSEEEGTGSPGSENKENERPVKLYMTAPGFGQS